MLCALETVADFIGIFCIWCSTLRRLNAKTRGHSTGHLQYVDAFSERAVKMGSLQVCGIEKEPSSFGIDWMRALRVA